MKPEPDRKPDDLNANERLVDAADPANEEEILKALGAMEVDVNTSLSDISGEEAEVAAS